MPSRGKNKRKAPTLGLLRLPVQLVCVTRLKAVRLQRLLPVMLRTLADQLQRRAALQSQLLCHPNRLFCEEPATIGYDIVALVEDWQISD